MDVHQDIQQLSKMALRRKYKGEANTHRNMLARRSSEGTTVHPAFLEFSEFLSIVGPKPTKSATLDRIDYLDREYAPGKVRWADKRTQSSNKSDAHLFAPANSTITFTTAQLAKQQGVSMSGIRKRKERGWTDNEIAAGQRQAEPGDNNDPRPKNPKSIGLFTSRISHAQVPEEDRPRLARDPKTGATYHINGNGMPIDSPLDTYRAEQTADILWQRREDTCLAHRHLDGEEYCIMTWEELVEGLEEQASLAREDRYEEHFWRWWLRYRDHIRREKLLPHQIAYIEKLEAKFLVSNTDLNEAKTGQVVSSEMTPLRDEVSRSAVTSTGSNILTECEPFLPFDVYSEAELAQD